MSNTKFKGEVFDNPSKLIIGTVSWTILHEDTSEIVELMKKHNAPKESIVKWDCICEATYMIQDNPFKKY